MFLPFCTPNVYKIALLDGCTLYNLISIYFEIYITVIIAVYCSYMVVHVTLMGYSTVLPPGHLRSGVYIIYIYVYIYIYNHTHHW